VHCPVVVVLVLRPRRLLTMAAGITDVVVVVVVVVTGAVVVVVVVTGAVTVVVVVTPTVVVTGTVVVSVVVTGTVIVSRVVTGTVVVWVVVTGTVVVPSTVVVVVTGVVTVLVVVTGIVTVVFATGVRQTPPETHDDCGVACALASTSIGPTITAESAAQPPRMARIRLFRGIIVIQLAFPEPGLPDSVVAVYGLFNPRRTHVTAGQVHLNRSDLAPGWSPCIYWRAEKDMIGNTRPIRAHRA
jgi:hypothetical protein